MSEQFSPQHQPEAGTEDDSMQLKRDRLGVTEESAVEDQRLGYVDRLLKSAPMLSAPLGFAERVIARLKAEPPRVPRYEEGTGIALGLGAAALLVIPFLTALAIVLGGSLLNEDFRADAWSTLTDVTGGLVDLVAGNVLVSLCLGVIAVLFFSASGYVVWFWRTLMRSARHLRDT